MMNQASTVSACQECRRWWKRSCRRNRATVADQMRLGITAAFRDGRRGSQVDLRTGGTSGLRQVRAVGVRGCLGRAHADTHSLIVTLTSTGYFVLGGRL